MNKIEKLIAAYRNGCKIPYQAMRAADEAGIPFHVMCAFLEQESSGGMNVFGHDPTIFIGAGRVTKKKYLRYLAERKRTGKMQGVGPMQLTWWEFQDRADKLGGCWKPYINCLVGAQLLKSYWNEYGNWIKVGERYNGRHSYGIEVQNKINRWKEILK